LNQRITTIIPAFNREAYVTEAIRSVLAQTRPVDELIVVDDGSTDGTRRAVDEFGERVRYAYQENAGAGAARNTGLSLATGDLVTFLDSDDLWVADKTKRQLEAFTVRPDIDVVAGQVEQFISPELPDEISSILHCPSGTMPGLVAGAIMVRRAVFEKVGVFDPSLTVGEFIDWFSRATDAGIGFKVLPDLVLRRRIHRSNAVVENRDSYSDYVRLVKRSLDRRRAGFGQ
jgi:glycosyltransferase involved in cell wall biosynthesis